jgi:hypothetical protein
MTTDPMSRVQVIVAVETKRIVNELAGQTRDEMGQTMRKFSNALRQSRSVQKGMKELHRHVAQGSMSRIQEAYASSGLGRGQAYRHTESDPKLKRYAKGAMKRALRDPGIIKYDEKTFRFINTQVMDQHARQWYRLNFGAGPKGRGGNQPVIKSWKIGKTSIPFTLSLAGYGASKNFRVPHSVRYSGAWSTQFSGRNLSLREARAKPGAGAGDALYLVPMRRVSAPSYFEGAMGKKKRKRGGMMPEQGTSRGTWSKGIRGRHFLEKGVDYINREYPKQLNSLIDAWVNASRDSIGRRRPFTWKPI